MTLTGSSLRLHSMQIAPCPMPRAIHKGNDEMDSKVTYRQQMNFCGKPRCRKCRDGIGHGPYWYAYRVNAEGRTVRTYIGKHLPPGAQRPDSTEPAIAIGSSKEPSIDPSPVANRQIAQEALHSGIDTLERLLAADPTNEEAVQRLMFALGSLKRRAEALRVYQRFVGALKNSREPSQETRALYEAVRRGEDLAGDYQGRSEGQPEVQIGRSNQSPLVGREHELAVLWQLLETTYAQAASTGKKKGQVATAIALERPRPQCMVLMGEAGIGKTRLAEETAREARRQGWAVVWSRAYLQESGIPYRLWSEALRRMIAQGLWGEPPGGDVSQRAYMLLEALVPELRDVWVRDRQDNDVDRDAGRDQSGPYNHNPLSPEQEQVHLREAVYELLTAISTSVPLLIVLDDVQWADGSSCELLGYLARRLHGHPIILLATCRETELASTHPLRALLAHMQREHAVEYLHVQPLSDTQIGTLVAHLPEPMVQHIQTQAGGNPFFAEELARNVGTQVIASNQASDQPPLPKTITAALDQRLGRLSNPCQQLLAKAAVLGGSFGLPLIHAMEASSSDRRIDEDTILDLLEEALHSRVLAEEGTGTRITYHFWHPLLASHLYNGLSAARRSRLHRRAAEVLEKLHATREAEEAAAITEHLVKGGAEPAQIAHYAELAGNHAYALSAYPEAEKHYRLAIEKVEAMQLREGQRLAYLLERLAECTRIQGKFEEARQLFERVLAVRSDRGAFASPSEDQEEAEIQALLWSEIGWTWRYTGDNQLARQCLERGEQVLRDAGILTGLVRARMRFQLSSLYWQEGNYEEARRTAQEALKLFEENLPQQSRADDAARLTRTKRTLLGDPVDLGRTHALLGALANALGQRNEALDHLSTALAIYERHDRQREIAHVCCNMGYVHLKRAEYASARALLHRSFNLAERIGDIPLMAVVFHNLGELAISSGGNLSEAEALYRRSLALAEQINDREYLSLWNADFAMLLVEQGNLSDAAVYIGRALRIGRVIHNTPGLGLALIALGNLRIAQAKTTKAGHSLLLKRAKAILQRALALQGLEVETRIRGQLALAEASLLLGDLEQARQTAVQAMEEARRYEIAELVERCKRMLEESGDY